MCKVLWWEGVLKFENMRGAVWLESVDIRVE